MNTPFPSRPESPLLSATVEEFHPTYVNVGEPEADTYDTPQVSARYNIVIKRNDALYKTLSVLNTIFSVFGVIMVVATFFLVCYGVVMLSQVFNVVAAIKNQ